MGKIVDGILSIPEAIGKFIKKLFIPEDGFLDGAMDRLNKSFLGLLASYDLTALASGSKELTDVTCVLYGKKVTILDAGLVMKGISFFRSVIRGFIALLLVLFNINMFLGFIGQPAISIVGGVRALSQNDKQGKGSAE